MKAVLALALLLAVAGKCHNPLSEAVGVRSWRTHVDCVRSNMIKTDLKTKRSKLLPYGRQMPPLCRLRRAGAYAQTQDGAL